MIADATYTQFDEIQANAYIDNRNILFQLWDLATTYPCIASKIEVRIRQADPREDYAYEESMSDAAIVVTLRWLDTENTCKFFRCNGSYPQNGKSVQCHPMTEPRVYPSGDSTTMTACEPACFFVQNLKSLADGGSGIPPPSHSEINSALYSSNAHSVMSVRDGKYRRRNKDGSEVVVSSLKVDDDDVVMVDAAAAATTAKAPNLSVFEYVRQTDSCELANVSLIEFITQPMKRGDGTECRVANFAIGEDLLRGVKVDGSSMLPPGNLNDGVFDKDVFTATGRLGESYCNGFGKLFDPATRTCVVSWWEKALSYIFLGSALIRFSRHALHGGDSCDEILPASQSRAETSSKDEDVRLLSRREWFNDVDRSWVCPPPNVLLSDLNIKSRGVVWTNRNGGSLERAVPSDYAATAATNIDDDASTPSSSMSDTDLRNKARRALLQRRRRQRRRRRRNIVGDDRQNNADDDGGCDDPPFVGRIESSVNSGDDGLRRKRDAALAAVAQPEVAQLLNFDEIYDHMTITDKNRRRGSDIVRHAIDTLATEVGIVSMQIIIQEWVNHLMKSSYNRALRFVGQRLGGAASRTLIALSVRVGTARMISAAVTGLSTRLMLTLGTASTGVGAIVSMVELLSFVLDMAIIFGWDPGNYNSEMGNDTFDGFALTWARMRSRERMPHLDPYYVLLLYSATYSSSPAVVNENIDDESTEANTRSDRRFDIRSVDDAPWFFAPFPDAIRAMTADLSPANTAPVVVTHDGSNDRIRPIFANSPVICNLLWTIHYFSHRRFNSNGQRVRGVGRNGDVITIDDDVIHDAVRSNELAAFLNQSTLSSSVPRARLVGAARRNFVAKSMRLLDHIVTVAGLIVGATVAGGAFLIFRPRLPFAVAWLLVFALLFVVLPLTLVPTIVEMIAAPDGGAAALSGRAYDRKSETNDRDNLDRICDEMANVLLSAVEADSTIGRVAATHFLPELKVLGGAQT